MKIPDANLLRGRDKNEETDPPPGEIAEHEHPGEEKSGTEISTETELPQGETETELPPGEEKSGAEINTETELPQGEEKSGTEINTETELPPGETETELPPGEEKSGAEINTETELPPGEIPEHEPQAEEVSGREIEKTTVREENHGNGTQEPPPVEADPERPLEVVVVVPRDHLDQGTPETQAEKETEPVKGPLSGIRILDLTRLYPGPLATMMMAEMGADVIKVEDRISPDAMRSYPPFVGEDSAGFLAVNRSKRSIALRFNEERGQEVFFQLVKNADLVIEQFRPGVLDGLGMGYFEAIKGNPRIIYVSLSGYGQKGPYAQRAGHDVNYVGYAGIAGATGSEKGGLTLPGVQIADVAGGAYMTVIAALSALWSREKTGAGQKVDVSMLDGTMPLISLQMAHYWATGQNLPPWQLPLSGGVAFYGIYKCADGKYITLGAIEPKFWKRFCEVVGKPQWIGRLYVQGEEAEKLKIELARLFKKRSRDEWIELTEKVDVCVSPVLEMSEIEHDPHLKARNIIVEYDHPAYGKIKGIGTPIKFSRHSSAIPTPAPALGEHTLEILHELGYEEDDIQDLIRTGAVYIHHK
jgi:crotonobetainyl-CoA:carnitine CoA-transferase CaiB-like acyl-CoA transferase